MAGEVLYGRITRVEELDDGTVYVEGCASTEERDNQPSSLARFGKGQIIRASAMRAALPEYLRYPAVREMHQPIAAGKASWAEVRDDNRTYMGAHVVDPGSVLKIKTGVLRAFSVNGSVLERNADDPSIIEKLSLTEISLVDVPGDTGVDKFTVIRLAEGAPMAAQTAPATTPVPAAIEATPEAAAPAPAPQPADAVQRAAGDGAPPAPVPALTPGETVIPTALANKIARATYSDAIKRFLGQETWDAKMALDALGTLYSLLSYEAEDTNAEAASQRADLLAAIEKIKSFVASEIQEGAAPAESPAVDAVAASREPGDLQRSAEQPPAEAPKTTLATPEQITRVAELEDIVSRAGEALRRVMDERAAVVKELETARAELARKGVLRVVAVDKAADGSVQRAAEGDGTAAAPQPADTHSLIKRAQQSPVRILG